MARKKPRKVLLVTGLSGAGMSTALRALEDLGYKAVDNLPLALVEPLLSQAEGRGTPVALGIDSRTWDFSAAGLIRKIAALKKNKANDIHLLFLDCQEDVLHQRFTETRRVHPLAVDRPVKEGVALEKQMMRPVRRDADHVIDTSAIKAQDLKRIIAGYFKLDKNRGLSIFVTSFGFKNGLPREADLVFDVRFLDNPYWDAKLRPLSGLDKAVIAKVRKDKGYKPFFKNLTGLVAPLLPRYDHEGKHYLTIAVGCTGGRHRSVCVAQELSGWLEGRGYNTTVRHRDMESWGRQYGAAAPETASKKKEKKK